MASAPNRKSVAAIWTSAGFVIAVFLLLGLLAAARLHRHQNAEVFLGRNGWTDSALALLAPLAALARVFQARRDVTALRASQA